MDNTINSTINNIPYKAPLVYFTDTFTNRTEIQQLNILYKEFLKSNNQDSFPTVIFASVEIASLMIWYINYVTERAYKKSIKDKTVNQHTVPRLINKTFAAVKPSDQKQYFKKVDTYDFKSTWLLNTVKATYDSGTLKKLELVNNETISVYENIYDSPNSLVFLPLKFVESFLAINEGDAAPIFKKMLISPLSPITWYERCVLSLYGLLQFTRTNFHKITEADAVKQMVELTRKISPELSIQEAEDLIKQQTGLGNEFGASILKKVTLENLNFFFRRDWSFLLARYGLVLNTEPFVCYDEDEDTMEQGGLMNPTHYMIAVNRNLLWNLEGPPDRDISLGLMNTYITYEENIFINSLISGFTDAFYMHPNDSEFILNNKNAHFSDFKNTRWQI